MVKPGVLLAVIYLSLLLRLDWQRSFRLIAAAFGLRAVVGDARLNGEDACHTAGRMDQGYYVTLSARCKGEGKFGSLYCILSYCVRACTTMTAARIYAAA